MLPFLTLLLLLSQAPRPVAPARPSPSSWSADDLEFLTSDRESLRGISRVAVSVTVPDELSAALPHAPLTSLIVFRLEQAGLTVVASRELEDPVLAIALHVSAPQRADSSTTDIYNVTGDLLQLVRLKDDARRARFMHASTWHVSAQGHASPNDADQLRARVMSIVDVLLDDWRAANGRAEPGPKR